MIRLSTKFLDEISSLEDKHYPSDEGASKETIKYRLENAPSLFYGLLNDQGVLIGFINGTRSESKLTHDTMFEDNPKGNVLCIHSVVIDQKFQRKGLGSKMLKEYIEIIKDTEKNIQKILLLCKGNLIEFYKICGFKLNGPSDVVHGSELWYEMELNFQ